MSFNAGGLGTPFSVLGLTVLDLINLQFRKEGRKERTPEGRKEQRKEGRERKGKEGKGREREH